MVNGFPAERLAAKGLAPFQGPALLAYNDAVFSEADFKSISNIGDSVKRDQKGKTGRFGVGFNVQTSPTLTCMLFMCMLPRALMITPGCGCRHATTLQTCPRSFQVGKAKNTGPRSLACLACKPRSQCQLLACRFPAGHIRPTL